MHAPLEGLFYPLVFVMSKLCYEVRDDLPFDSGLVTILDVKLAQFYGLEC